MEHSKTPTDLSLLLEAFGWDRQSAFVQQDIQEFCCLLIDILEKRFSKAVQDKDNTQTEPPQNLIKNLFNGETETVISCRNVLYESKKKEPFIDIQLSLKKDKTKLFCIEDSLRDFLAKEELVGENKYYTENHGKQDADKRVRFKELPKILMLHLRRCEFDYQTDLNKKIKHRVEFPESLDMDQFKDEEFKSGNGCPYSLFGIFVHHGTEGLAGHYTVLLKNSEGWVEFDDEHTKTVDWQYVQRNAFGGTFSDLVVEKDSINLYTRNKKSISNAYMLMYVDKSQEQSKDHLIGRYSRTVCKSVSKGDLGKYSEVQQRLRFCT